MFIYAKGTHVTPILDADLGTVWVIGVRFQGNSFTPISRGGYIHFPSHRYWFLLSLSYASHLAWTVGGPAGFIRIFSCPALLRISPLTDKQSFRIRGFHPLTGRHFSSTSSQQMYFDNVVWSYNPRSLLLDTHSLTAFPQEGRSHGLGNQFIILFSYDRVSIGMFQGSGFASADKRACTGLLVSCAGYFYHSDIRDQKV